MAGKRPDRATIVYTQRCKEAFKDVPVIIGGIEASLRRIAHYDYWQDKVRRSVLIDSKADLLLYGNAERAIVEVSPRPGPYSHLPLHTTFTISQFAVGVPHDTKHRHKTLPLAPSLSLTHSTNTPHTHTQTYT